MITYKQYMQNTHELHHEYYMQFVTEATKEFIEKRIGLEKLRTSKCEHLNDLYKRNTGGTWWLWDDTPINTALLAQVGGQNTRSMHTCVGKAYAKHLLGQVK